jgi:hypothetical protein
MPVRSLDGYGGRTSGQRCRCGAVAMILFDHCAVCHQTLCDECFHGGCCGTLPARSGIHDSLGVDGLDLEFG